MKKILDLLEQKVQWIVLGLALLYAGYITYYYVVTPRVTVEVNGTPLTPGDIDKFTLSNVGNALKTHMQSPKVVATASAPSYVADFQANMGYTKDSNPAWPDAAVVIQNLPKFKSTDSEPGPDVGPKPGANNQGVADLIKLTPAKLTVPPRVGLSTVTAPNAGAAALVANAGQDKSWVTVMFEIDPKQLAAAWDMAKIPKELSGNTQFVQVVMERQELGADGKWGPTTIVPTLPFITLMPLPKENAEAQDINSFFNWAKGHTRDILQPDFYTVVKGDNWAPPGVAVAGAAPAAPAFRAEDHLKDTQAQLLLLTLEQRRAVAELKAKQPAPARGPARGPTRPPRSTPTPTPPAGGDAPPAEYNFGTDTSTDRPISYQAADQNPPAAVDGAAEDPNAGNAPAPQAQQGNFPMPQGMFDPQTWVSQNPAIPHIVGWAHDDTATPGQTYRYRVTYRLKNPIYFAAGFAKDPANAKIFSVASPPSEWSQNVRISSTINFFVARRGAAPNSVSADVFRRQGGAVKRKTFEVTAGDMIGGQDGGVDYTTGFTMVDIRQDPRTEEIYVLLMDSSGTIQRRDFSAEQQDQNFKLLQGQAAAGANANNVAVP